MDWTKHKEGDIPTKHPGELRILSIDGGGMKGILPAVYLKRVEELLGTPISQHFDMICGTSTGGIIALGLAAGVSANDIANLYVVKGKEIFPKFLIPNPIVPNLYLSSKYKNNRLAGILKDTLGDLKLKDSNTMLCIPSIKHHKAEPKVFKTPHHREYTIDPERYMWEVALATSAAPMYFPAANIPDAGLTIDGGLWANNPVLVAIAEAKKLGYSLDQIKVLSIGTGDAIYCVNKWVAKISGLLWWRTKIVDLTFQVQSKSASYTAGYLLGSNFCRIAPSFGRKMELDSTKKIDIEFMVDEANEWYEKSFIKDGVRDTFFGKAAALT